MSKANQAKTELWTQLIPKSWLNVFHSSSPQSWQTFVIMTLFFILYFSTMGITSFWASISGFSPDSIVQMNQENELLYQLISLVGSFIVGLKINKVNYVGSIQSFYKNHKLSTIFEMAGRQFLKGFTFASVIVAFEIFMGLQIIKAPNTEYTGSLSLIYVMILPIFMMFLWVMLLEFFRQFLFESMTENIRESLWASLLMIGFESFLLFRLLSEPNDVVSLVFSILVCLFIAGLSFFWFHQAYSYRSLDLATENLSRIFIKSGFAIALIHVYGQSLATYQRPSFLYSLSGHVEDLTGVLSHQGLVGQSVFVLSIFMFSWALIWRERRLRDPR